MVNTFFFQIFEALIIKDTVLKKYDVKYEIVDIISNSILEIEHNWN